jgi:phthalate 4,5-dioxygenase oxygenase subunit
MLSASDNALLCQVGRDAPMGALLRRYWVPALLSSELHEPQSPPLEIRILGEDLTAFRTTVGVGIIQSNCPHRGAPLYYGRSEAEGIRCSYHGWLFDAAGRCLEMPNEPAESNFHEKVRARAYPCVERGGIVWTYMGPDETPPPLPEIEWNMVPQDQVYVTKRIENCSFMQALEGEIDSSHSTFLHSKLSNDEFSTPVAVALRASKGQVYRMRDKRPKFSVVDSPSGVTIGASYNAEETSRYWRITQFLMPYYTLIPPYGISPVLSGHAWVPIDDEHTMALCFSYHPSLPLSQEQIDILRNPRDGLEGLHPTIDAFEPPPSIPGNATWRTKLTHQRRFPINRRLQRDEFFSGIAGVWPQDTAMQEGMGPIYDRTQEHLGTTDAGIIRTRKRLLDAARALRERGVDPPPAECGIRAASVVVEGDGSWLDATLETRTARPGVSDDAP